MNKIFRWKVCLICSALLAAIVILSYVSIFVFGVITIPNYAIVTLSISWIMLVGGVLSTVIFCLSIGFAIGISFLKLKEAKINSAEATKNE